MPVAYPAEIVVVAARPDDQSRDRRLGAIVLGADAVDRSASGRIEDVLARIPSLQSFRRSDSRSSNPSAQGLTLRGLGGNASSRTLVLLDGIPIADPFFGYVPLSALDPARLKSAVVLRGAGGGAFGSAVAGTIALESTAPGERARWDGHAGVAADAASELGAGAALGLGGAQIAVDGRWDRGRGFWTTPDDQRTAASVRAAYATRQGSLRTVVPLGGGALDARLRGFDDRRTLRFERADSTMRGLDGSVRYVAPDRRWTLAGWHQRRDFSSVVVSAASLRPVLDQYATPARSSGVMGQVTLAPGIAVGADAKTSSGTARERALMAGRVTADRAHGGRTREAALFAEAQGRRGAIVGALSVRLARLGVDRLSSRSEDALGAVQFDRRYDARHATALTGRASLVLERPGWTARAAAMRGVRQPTLNELTRSFTVFPVTTRANPALEPERLTGAELALTVTPSPQVALGGTVFAQRLAGAIGNVTLAANLRERRNLEAIHSSGVEFDARWQQGPWGIEAAASFLRARVREPGPLDGLRPAQVPARSGHVTLFRDEGPTRLSMTIRHVSRAFEDDLNRDALPAATTVDVVARRRLSRRLELSLRGENLLDERIVTRNQGGSIDLGAPRTLWLSLDWAVRPTPSPR